MEITPYLNFNGNCAAAFRFYEACLGGRIVAMLTHAETPAKDSVPASWQDKIMHARLEVDGQAVMGSDVPPEHFAATKGMTVSITIKSPKDGERIFTALSEGGKVNLPFQETFWSPGFGMVVDRFGIPWMVNCEPAAAQV